MEINRRVTLLESDLEGKERILAWFKKAQALGGFFDYCKAANEPLFLEDEESAFLFHLVTRCNGDVLEVLVSPLQRLLAMYLLRLVRAEGLKIDEVELSGFPVLLHNFVLEGLALESAIQQISNEHFGGIQILFADLGQKLAERNQAAEQLRRGYNATAPKFGFAPITDNEIQASMAEQTSRKASELISLSRAEAAAKFGSFHEARELLLPLIADDKLRQFICAPVDAEK